MAPPEAPESLAAGTQAPDFAAHKDEVEVVLMQAESTPAENQRFLANHNYDFTILAAKAKVFQAYRVSATPTTVVLGADNSVLSTTLPNTLADLKNIMD